MRTKKLHTISVDLEKSLDFEKTSIDKNINEVFLSFGPLNDNKKFVFSKVSISNNSSNSSIKKIDTKFLK